MDKMKRYSGKWGRGGRVTLKDIARRSGYTVNTVSHALRGKSDISLEARRKIKALAREMGYMGNSLASSLRLGTLRHHLPSFLATW